MHACWRCKMPWSHYSTSTVITADRRRSRCGDTHTRVPNVSVHVCACRSCRSCTLEAEAMHTHLEHAPQAPQAPQAPHAPCVCAPGAVAAARPGRGRARRGCARLPVPQRGPRLAAADASCTPCNPAAPRARGCDPTRSRLRPCAARLQPCAAAQPARPNVHQACSPPCPGARTTRSVQVPSTSSICYL